MLETSDEQGGTGILETAKGTGRLARDGKALVSEPQRRISFRDYLISILKRVAVETT